MTTSSPLVRFRPGLRTLAFGLALSLGVQAHAEKPRKPLDPAAKMPPLKPAVIDDTLAIGGEEIAARKVNSRLTVEVGINGTGPYRFVVDSGADTSVISHRLADALALPPGRPTLLNGITESRQVERVKVDTLRLGSSEVRDLQLPRLSEHNIGAVGMIGLDALVEQRLMLDFEKRKISIDDGRTPMPRFDGEIVVTARLKRGQLILTKVRAGNIALDAVVDTGSEVTIGNSALRNSLFRRRNVKVYKAIIAGVTGKEVPVDIVHVDELKLGSVVLRNVPVAFADVPPFAVFGLQDHPSLLLGTDLMENFRKVSLDFRSRKVRFQLRKCAPHGMTMSTTGTASILAADTDNAAACKP